MPLIARAQRLQRSLVEGGEDALVERRAAGRVRTLLPAGARPRLVQQVVAEDPVVAGEAARDVLPRLRVAVADADTARSWRVLPEVVEGTVDRRLRDVVAGKARLGLRRQAVVEYRPVRPALALEALVVHVLVEVEQRDDAVARQRVGGRADAVEVGVVVDTGLGLDGLVDDAEAHRVVALARQKRRVVLAEATDGRLVGRDFVNEVYAVGDKDATR